MTKRNTIRRLLESSERGFQNAEDEFDTGNFTADTQVWDVEDFEGSDYPRRQYVDIMFRRPGDDESLAYLSGWQTPDGNTFVIQAVEIEDDAERQKGFGTSVLSWLDSLFDEVGAIGVETSSIGFWEKMQDRGLLDWWQPISFSLDDDLWMERP